MKTTSLKNEKILHNQNYYQMHNLFKISLFGIKKTWFNYILNAGCYFRYLNW